ncbi:MAG: transporter substrate-binding domain-containing protein [Candidatus Fimenecus sp.]
MKMKKLLCLLLAVVMLVGCFAACGKADTENSDLAYIKEKGTLVIGITDYAPMNYKEEGSTEWTGFDTEYARLVAEKLGVTAEFIVIDWDNKYTELDAKSIDCIWNGMTITEEGKLNASITDAYVKNAQVVVMAKDKLDQYPDAESMKDLRFAVENGSAGAQAAEEAGFTNVTAVVDQPAALLEVSSGAVDACIIDITMANAMTGEGTSYANYGYKLELTSEEYGIACRKDSDLTAEINRITAELMADGSMDALAEKYQLTLIK